VGARCPARGRPSGVGAARAAPSASPARARPEGAGRSARPEHPHRASMGGIARGAPSPHAGCAGRAVTARRMHGAGRPPRACPVPGTGQAERRRGRPSGAVGVARKGEAGRRREVGPPRTSAPGLDGRHRAGRAVTARRMRGAPRHRTPDARGAPSPHAGCAARPVTARRMHGAPRHRTPDARGGPTSPGFAFGSAGLGRPLRRARAAPTPWGSPLGAECVGRTGHRVRARCPARGGPTSPGFAFGSAGLGRPLRRARAAPTPLGRLLRRGRVPTGVSISLRGGRPCRRSA
jgi:hypothetical protein